jgi:signal transduction histidine kinase
VQRDANDDTGGQQQQIIANASHELCATLTLLRTSADYALCITPPGGSIKLGATQRGKEVEILVSDTGRGIPAKDLPHMFERFYRVADQPQEGCGNGLGFSIAHSLIDMHRGLIIIASQPGQGTKLQILLPAAEK